MEYPCKFFIARMIDVKEDHPALASLGSGTALTSVDRFAQELRIWRVRVQETGSVTESEIERKRVSGR